MDCLNFQKGPYRGFLRKRFNLVLRKDCKTEKERCREDGSHRQQTRDSPIEKIMGSNFRKGSSWGGGGDSQRPPPTDDGR